MNIEIRPLNVDDDAEVAEVLALRKAVNAADTPDQAAPCGVAFRARLREHDHNHRHERAAAIVDGRVVGLSDLEFPQTDNLHAAWGGIEVLPEHRRRGIGGALMEHAIAAARADDRRSLCMDACVTGDWPDVPKRDEAGRHFLESFGFDLALKSIDRRADVEALDAATIDTLHAETLAKSADYETVAWSGTSPDELLAPMAALNSTFLDEAPLGDLDLEAEKIDAERERDRRDRAVAAGLFTCGVVARLKGSEDLVAITVIGVPTEPGTHAHQWMTLVSPEHRGHKLGLRVKLENWRLLRRERPRVRWIDTDNAAVNDHMIAINEAMGFKPVDYLYEYQLDVTKTSH
ncbi:MAG TPA: GNAT family N-acetyltransferase [Stackebrandtia sp.]|uniref:GNAT family N-acetyltransferase n=1 Tax=Stackebrandtia sp. TaxID=2023065 RepID=UPI002D686E23|nr:GNAT family N-acetyltransferase [Stackebrandtia sp.]HZE40363.1 GNAT family N-acetyltransferase [Stackebrandtia sp.]